ncbi:HNH endonuclease [Sphingobacteriales bacterium CHB3]|nr:HNH endonuclease [Sphingobacteriales bacterium CHB3]
MNVDDIISYAELVHAEKANLQKGMNFGIGKSYSVFLMSVRKGAPYADQIDPSTGNLIYEGHDQHKTKECPDPKSVDQPLTTPKGSWTENGKFFRAAMDFKGGLRKRPELVKVYEKIANGIWCYKGFFELVDASIVSDGKRKVFKFYLKPVQKKRLGRTIELPHNRLIPTQVKLEVWKRDGGKCVECCSTKNLHYDHDIPFSKGGSSLTAMNVRLLCAKHNLEKSDKIMSLLPWVAIAGSFAEHLHKN